MSDGTAQAWNMRLISQSDLGGFGNGGEGLALQATSDGRRILYVAHESGPKDFTALDVTAPSEPIIVAQTEVPNDRVRSNSLDMVDDLLLVAYQGKKVGDAPVGMGVWDVKDPENPVKISHFDTSGPHSRGAHCLWFADGRYAYLATGAGDFQPHNPLDDQFLMIVDVGDPTDPTEVGRWWLPGTRVGDTEDPPDRHPEIDTGFRLHNGNVWPEKPDRAYLGYIDGGAIILDVSDKSKPSMISRVDYHPPFPGFTHTVMPIFNRDLLIVSDESIVDHAADHPKYVWVMDGRDETNPVIISTFPLPDPDEFKDADGRFGAHNLNENKPGPLSMQSDTLIVGSYFNGGVRVHDISNPFRPIEVAYYIPAYPEGMNGVNINDVYWDENGLIYAIDRFKGGMYILELTL